MGVGILDLGSSRPRGGIEIISAYRALSSILMRCELIYVGSVIEYSGTLHSQVVPCSLRLR